MPHGSLEVFLVSAKGFEDMDVFGQGSEPVWNENFVFNVSEELKIMDSDVGSQDFVGEAEVILPQFMEGMMNLMEGGSNLHTRKEIGIPATMKGMRVVEGVNLMEGEDTLQMKTRPNAVLHLILFFHVKIFKGECFGYFLANQSRLRGKAKKVSRISNKERKGIGAKSLGVLASTPHLSMPGSPFQSTSDRPSQEAEAILSTGKRLGVEFDASDEAVLRHFHDLEEADGN
ncbi:hypothetical protein V6N12_073726 [Hibiscus sabdariffa]|uniref:C2 domain-containing protein n=1 Tax=Hibiscus sabdariffa TaxID=183260 RepID=A0ABR2CTA7_9ROSI